MKKILFCLVFLLFFIAKAATASSMSHLNTVMVPVANKSPEARQAALPQALGQVLVKLSGNSAVMSVAAIQSALNNVEPLIQSYAYTDQEQSDGQTVLQLQVTFDQKALKQLLQQANQSEWSQQRPLTLLWIQIPNQGDASILSNTNNVSLSQVVQNAANLRGIPILLPTMDLQDESLINNRADPLDSSLLKPISDRYHASTVLAGNIEHNGNQWQGKWLLLLNNTSYPWSNTADSIESLLTNAINEMVDLTANRLSVVDNKDLQTAVTLEIRNVQDLDDYAKVISIVKHLTSVNEVTIKDMNGSDLLLTVNVGGGTQILSDALASQNSLTALDVADDPNHTADLVYRWQGESRSG